MLNTDIIILLLCLFFFFSTLPISSNFKLGMSRDTISAVFYLLAHFRLSNYWLQTEEKIS